jgi:hypothetical protein
MNLFECIIVSKEINNKFILAKNRDRAYKPTIEIIHTLLNGVEVVYLHDTITDWSEGMNEYGIGIVNSALLVGRDEAEKKIVKKSGKVGPDGGKIRNILAQKNLLDAVRAGLSYKGKGRLALKGHTFISSPNYMVSIETTSKNKPVVKLESMKNPIVRTNHGRYYTEAGYTEGDNYKSSIIRKLSAEKQSDKAQNWYDLAPLLRKKFFDYDSPLNMKRDTKLTTSTQMVLNLTDLIFQLNYFEKDVAGYGGVKEDFPKDYKPKIRIVVNKV